MAVSAVNRTIAAWVSSSTLRSAVGCATRTSADRAARVRRAGGAGSVEGPVDTPWFSRDLVATDPDGYVVVLTAPRLAEIAADREWSDTVTVSLGRRPAGG